MKRENLEEAKTIINRINGFETIVKLYEQFKEQEYSPFSLFINLLKVTCGRKKYVKLELVNDRDFYVGLSMKQQEELIELVNKWMVEDKKKLEEL